MKIADLLCHHKTLIVSVLVILLIASTTASLITWYVMKFKVVSGPSISKNEYVSSLPIAPIHTDDKYSSLKSGHIEPPVPSPALATPFSNQMNAQHEYPDNRIKPAKVPAPKLPASLQPLYEHAREFVLDGDWSRLLAAADIYKNGIYPEYIPDEDMALRLYHLCASCPDGEIAGLGQARYIELRLDPVSIEDRKGNLLPRDPGNMIASDAHERISRTPYGRFQTPVKQRIGLLEQQQNRQRVANVRNKQQRNRERHAVTDQLERIHHYVDGIAGGIMGTTHRANDNTGVHHRSDAQNVHDHGVTSGVRTSIGKMVDKYGRPTIGGKIDAVERTRHAVLTSSSPESEKMEALNVLENLTDYTHSTLGASEQETLALALREIESKDPQTRDNLMETLTKQLASGQERGLVVCSSGKISRIVGTFDGTGTFETEAKPLWAVRQEIGTMAANIREKHENDENRAREEFVRTAHSQYVQKLGMSKHILDPIIDEYADAF